MVDEDSPIKFDSVFAAVVWAERQLLRDGSKSQMGSIVGPSGYREETAGAPKNRMNADDVRDMAQTISCKVSRVDPPMAGMLYRFLCGGVNLGLSADVSGEISTTIWIRMADCGVPRMQVQRLVLSLMMAEKSSRRFGKKITMERIAHDIGVSKALFYRRTKPWVKLSHDTKEIIDRWTDGAESQLSGMLSDVGVL